MSKKSKFDKKRICVTIDAELVKFLDNEIGSKRFGTRSHGVEVALKVLQKKVQNGDKISYD